VIEAHYTKTPWREPPKKAPQFTPDTTWTTPKIRAVTTEHEEGYFYRAALLASWMMRDGRLATVTETRVKGMLGLPFAVTAASENPKREERKIVEALAAQWPLIMPEKVTAEVLECLVKLGFCLCQIVWHDMPSQPARWVPRLRLWNSQFCYYDHYREKWVISKADGQEEITPGDGKWVLFSFRDAAPWMAGLVRQLAIPVLIRSFSWSDWSSFNETLGQSFLKGTVPSWANKTEDDDNGTPSKDTFLTQLQGLGRDNRYILCEEGAGGEKFDAKYESPDGKGSDSFKEAQASASMEITTRVLGQNLTTEVSGTGSYAAATSHEEVRQDYKEADADTISGDVREQLIKPWALYNYGDAEMAPWAYYDPTPPADRKTNAEILKALSEAVEKLQAGLKGSGKRLDVEKLYTKFGADMLDGELEAAAAPATPPTPDRALRNIVPWRRRQAQQSQTRHHPQENL
jgi:phage gp29-like protein